MEPDTGSTSPSPPSPEEAILKSQTSSSKHLSWEYVKSNIPRWRGGYNCDHGLSPWPVAFVALKKQLPGAFVSTLEEPYQSLVLLRIEIPQRAASALARKNPADQHHLDDINELHVLGHHALNARLQRYQLVG